MPTYYESPRTPSMKTTITTAPTSQMIVFMECSLPEILLGR
jgi:hypothetical protein